MLPFPTDTTPNVLAALVGMADLLIAQGETDLAADVLAVVLRHPAASAATYARADALFDALEATVCPRVILDARTKAEATTLDALLWTLAHHDATRRLP